MFSRWPLVVALILSSYSLVLLWSSLSSKEQLRIAAESRLLADNARSAKALNDFAAELRQTAAAMASGHELRTYLANKALGMSAQYGLNVNLDILERNFRETVDKEKGDSKALRRVAFVSEGGEFLADSAPQEGAIPLPRQPAHDTEITLDLGRNWIVTRTPVIFKTQFSGTVVIVSELASAYRFLVDASDHGTYRETLLTREGEEMRAPGHKPFLSRGIAQELARMPEGELLPLSSAVTAGNDSSHTTLMAIKTSLKGWPVVLVTAISKDELYGHLSSTVFLYSLSLFPFLVLLAYRKLEAARRDAASHAMELGRANQRLNMTLTALQTAKNELVDKNVELKKAYQAAEDLSLTDPLTGMHNRRFLLQRLDGDAAMCKRRYEARIKCSDADGVHPEDLDITFFLVDIDHFKQVNDVHGHAAGDAVLSQMRERLANAVRSSDYIVRWGGEEFLVVARETDRAKAGQMAERIRLAVADTPFDIGNGQVLHKTCSIGFASLPLLPTSPDHLSWNQVLTAADHGLYIAKRSGRDTWVGIASADQCPAHDATELFARMEADIDAAVKAGYVQLESSRPLHKSD